MRLPAEAKIIIRSPNWVGDAVMATPLPAALRRAYPKSQIHVLAKTWVAPVWENHPDVSRIHLLEAPPARGRFAAWWSVAGRLRREHYDAMLVLPPSFSSAFLAWASGARQRVGYGGQGRAWCLTTAVPAPPGTARRPRPEAYMRLARYLDAVERAAPLWEFTVTVTPDERAQAETRLGPRGAGRRIGLAPGSVAPSRRWPADRYAQVARELTKSGHQVVLLGSQGDAPLARDIARRLDPAPRVLAGETTLREAIALIGSLDLVLSNDSGTVHLAYAQGVPVVVVQGAADPVETGPFGPRSRVVRAAGVECAPCVRNVCPQPDLRCMLGISVEAVLRAVRDSLKKPLPPARGSHGP